MPPVFFKLAYKKPNCFSLFLCVHWPLNNHEWRVPVWLLPNYVCAQSCQSHWTSITSGFFCILGTAEHEQHQCRKKKKKKKQTLMVQLGARSVLLRKKGKLDDMRVGWRQTVILPLHPGGPDAAAAAAGVAARDVSRQAPAENLLSVLPFPFPFRCLLRSPSQVSTC